MRAFWMVAVLGTVLGAALAGCGARDVREAGALVGAVETAPVVAMPRLALPARIGLVRLVEGRATLIPAIERTRWAGAAREVNRPLSARLDLVPLPPIAGRIAGPAADPGADPGAEGAGGVGDTKGADLTALFAAAGRAGFDAVLVYELSARAEDDRLARGLAHLPLIGGIVPRTVEIEGHGTAVAALFDPYTRTVIGTAQARMVDRPLTGLRTGGSPGALEPMALYAALDVLIPRAEDLLTGALSSGF